MKIKKISWFDEFNCMGGDCPQTCCRGWLIPLDEDDLARFKKERGRLGLRLLAATCFYSRDRMNLGSGECRFHTEEGLCQLQLSKGHDFIPWACRSFPRFYRNYGEFEERYLDLSCIEAAKMFVRNAGNLKLIEDEDEPATRLCTSNDDREFLEALINIRKEIVDAISGVCDADDPVGALSEMMGGLFAYAGKLQDTYARGGTCKDLGPFAGYVGKDEAETGNSDAPAPGFPLSPDTFSDFCATALKHFGLKKTGPELYSLLSESLAAARNYKGDRTSFNEEVRNLCINNKEVLRILSSYMSYFLYQYLLGTYETYSFRKVAGLTIIHTNMIMLLTLTVSSKGKEITGDELAYIIAIYNRKVFFNETIEDDMYRIFS